MPAKKATEVSESASMPLEEDVTTSKESEESKMT
jgi:hypothetical protein